MTRNAPVSPWALPSWLRAWERFWFTPADPTILGLIRICAGLIIVYTTFVYSFQLQEFMGPNAWVDLELRLAMTRERPVTPPPLTRSTPSLPAPGNADDATFVDAFKAKHGVDPRIAGLPLPKTGFERLYLEEYIKNWKAIPPAYVASPEEAAYVDKFIKDHNVDPRMHGLTLPKTEVEREYLEHYTDQWKVPPPEYPKSPEEAKQIDDYIKMYTEDPRRLYGHGAPFWSLWLHITDPTRMAMIHSVIIFVMVLFTLGFATRVTSVLTWFGAMTYIHRNTQILFGADAMIVIVMTYLMIGPSGAALSVDRLIARWWSRAKPGVVRRWARWLGRPEPTDAEIAPVRYSQRPEPSVSANVAIRLLQIHTCIVYLIAGLAKLQGNAWWSGTAVWFTIANTEFAPHHVKLYADFIRWLANSPFWLYAFMNVGTFFTLTFEIGYAFLIWRPATRWFFLAGALLLHGLIGMVMGLKTFALIMLVMNMAFLRHEEIAWVLSGFRSSKTPPHTPPPTSRSEAFEPAAAGGA